jgi:hypothetical protein
MYMNKYIKRLGIPAVLLAGFLTLTAESCDPNTIPPGCTVINNVLDCPATTTTSVVTQPTVTTTTVPETSTTVPVTTTTGVTTTTVTTVPGPPTFIMSGPQGDLEVKNVDYQGATIQCDPTAVFTSVHFLNVKNITVKDCKLRPGTNQIGAWIQGGSNITFDHNDAYGGSRGILIQATQSSNEATWSDGVTLKNNTASTVTIDLIAVYGAKNVNILDNTLTMTAVDGCGIEHQDGIQTTAIENAVIARNVITGDNTLPPTMNTSTEKCPADAQHSAPWFPSSQGIIATQALATDKLVNVTYDANIIKNWKDGFPFLARTEHASNVLIKDTKVCSSLRVASQVPKVEGTNSPVLITVQNTTSC